MIRHNLKIDQAMTPFNSVAIHVPYFENSVPFSGRPYKYYIYPVVTKPVSEKIIWFSILKCLYFPTT
jgi:hypothetical protein